MLSLTLSIPCLHRRVPSVDLKQLNLLPSGEISCTRMRKVNWLRNEQGTVGLNMACSVAGGDWSAALPPEGGPC